MAAAFRRPAPDSLAIGALLTALIALGQMSTALYVPSMPSLVGALGTTAERVTLTFTVFLVGFSLAQLAVGPLSDRFGRRAVLVGGLFVFIAASLACALAPTIEALIVSRLFQAVGACTGAVVGRAVVRDVHGREKAARVLAFIGVAFSVSPALAPIIGGFLQSWFGWRASFLFLTGVGLLVLALVLRMLAETNRDPDPHALAPGAMIANFGRLLHSPLFLGHALALSFVFSGLMAFVAAAPFLLIERLGMPPEIFGFFAGSTVVGSLSGNLAAGFLAHRVGLERMIRLGIGFALIGGGAMTALALAGVFSVVAIVVPVVVFIGGMGIVMPLGMAGAMAPFPRLAGAASALLGFFQMAAGAGASLIAGCLPHATQTPLALLMLALAFAAAAVFGFCVRPRRDACHRFLDKEVTP